jgi:hypothetical protein
MNEKEVARKAEELTSKIESGSTCPLSAELNKMSAEDRIAVARAMDALNFKHRMDQSNPNRSSIPDICISIGSKDGKEELLDMQAKISAPGGKGKPQYKDIFDREPEYDLKNYHKGTTMYAVARRGDDVLQSDFYGRKDGTLIIENPYPQQSETTRYKKADDVKWEATVNGVKTTVYKDGRRS